MNDCYQVIGWGFEVQFDYTVDGLAQAALLFLEHDHAVRIQNPNRVEWSDQLNGTDDGLTANEKEVLETVWGIVC